jgi:hypothetical protein
MQTSANIDRAATALSLACIVHCVALPIIAIALPFVATFAEAEWVHWLLTALAFLASSTVVVTAHSARTPVFLIPVAAGIVLMGSALFADHFGGDETLLTAMGGVLLAAAHIRRLYKYS